MGAWLKQLSQRTEGTPFEELAARYSFVVPFAAIFVSFVLITTSNLIFHTPGGIADVDSIAGCLLCVMLTSGIMGIVALFGISRHGWKRILWRAAIGVTMSVIVGFLAWLFLVLEHLKQ